MLPPHSITPPCSATCGRTRSPDSTNENEQPLAAGLGVLVCRADHHSAQLCHGGGLSELAGGAPEYVPDGELGGSAPGGRIGGRSRDRGTAQECHHPRPGLA